MFRNRTCSSCWEPSGTSSPHLGLGTHPHELDWVGGGHVGPAHEVSVVQALLLLGPQQVVQISGPHHWLLLSHDQIQVVPAHAHGVHQVVAAHQVHIHVLLIHVVLPVHVHAHGELVHPPNNRP